MDEGLLDRMELPVLLEPLDGAYRFPLGLEREHRAGVRRAPVDDHRARAAGGAIANALRAREIDEAGAAGLEVIPKSIEERGPRLDLERQGLPLTSSFTGTGPGPSGASESASSAAAASRTPPSGIVAAVAPMPSAWRNRLRLTPAASSASLSGMRTAAIPFSRVRSSWILSAEVERDGVQGPEDDIHPNAANTRASQHLHF